MLITDMYKAWTLNSELQALLEKRNAVKNGKAIMIAICSQYVEQDITEALAMPLWEELDKRVQAKIQQLEALGITFPKKSDP